MLVTRYSAALALLLSLAGQMVDAGAALGRDERRAERITGDDDPILIPRSAVPHSLDPGTLDGADSDPETTGSVEKPTGGLRPVCNMLAWFPERPPGQEFREVC
jgi:hypothetical protein